MDLLSGQGTPGVARTEPPGRYAYSNPAFGVLQQLLVDATGRPFEELAGKELFEPLGMNHSSFGPTWSPRLFALAAYGHSKEDEPIAASNDLRDLFSSIFGAMLENQGYVWQNRAREDLA